MSETLSALDDPLRGAMTCAKPSHAQPLAPFTVGELLSSDTLVSGVDACLRYLCAWWRDRTSATTVAIAVSDAHRDCDVVAVARETGDVEVWRQSRCQLASPALASRVSRLVSGACETAAIPLNSDGVTRGWLWFEPSLAILDDGDRGRQADPFEITARLLAAALQRELDAWHEKLESIAEFAAGAGHEINNPLGTILGRARQLLAHEADPERVRLLSTIGGQAVRARDMIGDAMVFARPPAPELSSVELPDVVSDVTGLLAGLLDAAAVQIEVQCHRPMPPIRADRVQAAIVVSELLRNAAAASQPGDTIALRIEPLQLDGRSVMQLTCGNRGDQLTETDLRHLFDPFYSGRSAGRGLGFGLAKCWRIVRLHEGCIHADLVAGELIVRVHWPVASHSIAPPSDAIDTGSR